MDKGAGGFAKKGIFEKFIKIFFAWKLIVSPNLYMKTLNFLNGKHIQSLRIEENRLIIFCAHGEYFRVFCENNNKITDKIQLRAEVSDDLLTLNSLISSKVLGVELFSAFNKIQFEIVTEHHRLFVYWLDYKQSEPLKLRIEKLVVGTYERLKIE